MEKNSPKNLVKWSLALALVIVVNLFFYYVIVLFYPEPKWDDFCAPQTQQYTTAESCVAVGGQWTNNQLSPKQVTEAVKNGEPLGWCDATYTCNNEYTAYKSIYNRNVFTILIVLSLVVLGLGMFLPFEVLTIGFSWSGIVSLIIASARYWSDAHNWMRVTILAIALIVLIWLSIKRFGQMGNK